MEPSHKYFGQAILQPSKHDIKTQIKTDLKKNYNGEYTPTQYLEIINTLVTKYDEKVARRILSKYTNIVSSEQIVINTYLPTYNKTEHIVNSLILSSLPIVPVKKLVFPSTKCWIHDKQVDDNISSSDVQRRAEIFRKIKSVIYPAQRSPEWYAQRDQKITASDIGLCLGDDHHQMVYYFLVKKFRETFSNNENTYHGKKFEAIATMIYEYRMNLRVDEFGLCHHPKYSFLGASPDGIVSEYKHDNIHKTNLVGRMLEIKCPTKRKIKNTGNIRGDICPTYYWDQVQIQLETCDLDECDFWQCDIKQYDCYEDFLKDTDMSQPYRSLKSKQEKGCLIQILPKDKYVKYIPGENDAQYNEAVWGSAQFIYPEKIEMTPLDCKKWCERTINNLEKTHPGYVLDKVVYWYLNYSFCQLIKRDTEWFKNSIATLNKMWSRVVFIRSNLRCKQIFLNYHDNYLPICNSPDAWKHQYDEVKKKKNNFMIELVDLMMKNNKENPDNFDKYLNKLEASLKDLMD